MPQSIRNPIWILLAASLVFFTNLGVPQLWDEDEPKNAACAREMLERNDWVVPMFNYELRTAKPVLLYWFMMSAYQAFGVNEFAARFWSAVFGVAIVLMTYSIGRRLFREQVGFWGALILAGGLMFGVSARAATPDATLIFFSTLALWFFVRGITSRQNWTSDLQGYALYELRCETLSDLRAFLPRSWWNYALMYTAMGFAVLAKGPVGVVLPTGILCLYVLFLRVASLAADAPLGADGVSEPSSLARRLGVAMRPGSILQLAWMLRPLTAIVLVTAVALPWYILVGLRTDGAWLQGFLGQHNVGRFLEPMEGHGGSIFYYVVAVFAGFFPWSVFLPLSLVQLTSRLRKGTIWSPGDVLIACWAGAYIVFFSLASTKLPSYVLPAYPALALITARCVDAWLTNPAAVPQRLLHIAFGVVAFIGIGFLVATPIATRYFLHGDMLPGLAGLIPLFGGVAAYVLVRRNQARAAATAFAATAILFATTLFGVTSLRVDRHQTSAALLQQIPERESARIASFGYFQPSLAFYARRPVEKLKTPEQVRELLESSPSAYVVVRSKSYGELEPQLPPGVAVLKRMPNFLRRDEVLLLGRTQANEASPQPIARAETSTVIR